MFSVSVLLGFRLRLTLACVACFGCLCLVLCCLVASLPGLPVLNFIKTRQHTHNDKGTDTIQSGAGPAREPKLIGLVHAPRCGRLIGLALRSGGNLSGQGRKGEDTGDRSWAKESKRRDSGGEWEAWWEGEARWDEEARWE